MILPALNGMGHMELLAQRFSPHNVVGGVLKASTTLDDDGRVVQLTTLMDVAYGELDGERTPRIAALDEFMRSAKINARLSPAIRREMWEKWTLLASLGAINCLTRGTVGEVEACPGGAAFALQLLDEVVAIVAAVGVAPSDGFLAGVAHDADPEGIAFGGVDVPGPAGRQADRSRSDRRRFAPPRREGGNRRAACSPPPTSVCRAREQDRQDLTTRVALRRSR